MWILGNGWRDSLAILFPGILTFFLVTWMSPDTLLYTGLAFFSAGIVDAGHVYTTAWRTLLSPTERKSHAIYWIAPVAIIVGITFWIGLKIPFLWRALAYLTLYHHLRQFYGVLRWYEKLGKRFCAHSWKFLYGLTVLPIFICHMRETEVTGIFTDSDFIPLYQLSSINVWEMAWLAYAGVWIGWVTFEGNLMRKGIREPSRAAAVLGPALLYALCLLVGTRTGEMIFPLLIAHGIPYFFMVGLALNRTQKKIFPSVKKVALTLGTTAVVLGGVDALIEAQWIPEDYSYLGEGSFFLTGLAVGFFLTPLVSHYIFDAVIWRAKHREAKQLYTQPDSSSSFLRKAG